MAPAAGTASYVDAGRLDLSPPALAAPNAAMHNTEDVR